MSSLRDLHLVVLLFFTGYLALSAFNVSLPPKKQTSLSDHASKVMHTPAVRGGVQTLGSGGDVCGEKIQGMGLCKSSGDTLIHA